MENSWIPKRMAPSVIGAVCLTLMIPNRAEADAGLPALFIIWPASWILFFVIVPLEALVARFIIKVDWRHSFLLSFVANAASTVVGIPPAWALAFLVPMSFAIYCLIVSTLCTWSHLVPENVPMPDWCMLPLFLMGPALGFMGLPDHGLSILLIFMVLPYFLVSVWSEAFIVKLVLKQTFKIADWSWLANGASYILIYVTLLFALPHVFGEKLPARVELNHGSRIDHPIENDAGRWHLSETKKAYKHHWRDRRYEKHRNNAA